MHNQELGDYLGVESCTDFTSDIAPITSRSSGSSCPRRTRRSDATEYPPPIALLARADNQPSHVPWVMRKHRTSDGRLVITEERARRRENFKAHRFDGRLVLSLIPAAEEEVEGGGEEEIGFPGNVADSGEEIEARDKRIGTPVAVAAEVYIEVEPCGGFGVAMAGFRPPVHT
ncbi:hypothetical protein SASPL_103130 [Salvia splendens]|uniref:FAF domain-containing protein n=1 Tax=Salvia splendens TaxID=180675 RepID=A0A8X9ADT2_SALSN|nr:uncharacterized protein LOC121792558 [Salvia splendens]KAG6438193.1 hypothetical protein SASPL_103130 [Salvia splendens]